jgi:hypothetical protein
MFEAIRSQIESAKTFKLVMHVAQCCAKFVRKPLSLSPVLHSNGRDPLFRTSTRHLRHYSQRTAVQISKMVALGG